MPGGCPTAYWLAEPLDVAGRQRAPGGRCRSAHRRCRCRASSPRTTRTATPRASASSRPTAKACSTASAPALAAAGANIIDARIHTTRDGMALDNLLVLDSQGRAYADRRLRGRLVTLGRGGAGRRAAAAACRAAPAAAARRRLPHRAVGGRSPTGVEPDDRGRGQCARPAALLARLARAIHELRPPHPFGAYRDLWRARGRRFLSDRRRTARS